MRSWQHLLPGGLLASLAVYAKSGLFPLDLRFRKDVKTQAEHVSLYVGLTSVLDVHHAKSGKLRLKVHETHQQNGKFDPGWSALRTPDELAAIWPDVELYLDRVIPMAARSHGTKEGAVQAAVAAHRSRERIVLDREVTPSFRDTAFKKQFMEECQRPILDALAKADLGFGGVPTKLGNECDALAVDQAGRVLAVEVKPLGVGSIAWVAAQAVMYARILQRWIDHDGTGRPTDPPTSCGACWPSATPYGWRLRSRSRFPRQLRVTPVVALQRGASPEMVRRMLAVRDVLSAVDMGVEPVEIYEVNLIGEWIPLDESRLPDGRPVARRNYARESNERAVRWKHNTSTLPDEARGPGEVRGWGGTYDVDYALPAAYAAHNLLPEVRDTALELFEKHEIAWHQAIDGGPTNHLRSSQVQCVNALGQMMTDPERIKRPSAACSTSARSATSVRSTPPRRAGSSPSSSSGCTTTSARARRASRTRGSQSTSVDAAFAYRRRGTAATHSLLSSGSSPRPTRRPTRGADRKEATRSVATPRPCRARTGRSPLTASS